jgi:hypothetical protein
VVYLANNQLEKAKRAIQLAHVYGFKQAFKFSHDEKKQQAAHLLAAITSSCGDCKPLFARDSLTLGIGVLILQNAFLLV